MGRARCIARYQITDQIKELQRLGYAALQLGYSVDVDISKDLVTFNGFKKMSRVDAKVELEEILENAKHAKFLSDYPDHEQQEREARIKAKEQKKHREPGAPPELRTLIRRAKRIWKKAFIKSQDNTKSSTKAHQYISSRETKEDDKETACKALVNYITKELAKL